MHGRHVMAPVLVAVAASAVVGVPTPGIADAPVAAVRDLGTGPGTTSTGVALAGRTAVGYLGGVPTGGTWLFRHDLDAAGATTTRLDDQASQSNISTVADADGPYVVGSHQVGTTSRSAYVYDVRTGSVTSLDRFGGFQGDATAVDQGVVVGSAELAPGQSHAFAYDVDGARQVLDLGTLGGPESRALAVNGDIVVGQADRSDHAGRGFVVDIAAPGRPMTEIGTFGGPESAATAVDGDLVVGWAESADGVRQAFAVRRSAPGSITSIGGLGGTTSVATDVDGEVAVGTATRADGSVGIWWVDLRTVPYVLHDLGTQVAGAPTPRVEGSTVLGTRQTAAGERGFVADVATGSLLDLDPQPGQVRTRAADVSGSTVLGTSYGTASDDSSARATTWTISTAPAPSFRLARHRLKASEGTTAKIKVVRSGDLRQGADVRYRVTGTKRGAMAGKDFRKGRGVVHFAPGQSESFIRVRIVDDRRTEGREKARVRIRAVTPGTTVTTPRTARLVIRASDRRPAKGQR